MTDAAPMPTGDLLRLAQWLSPGFPLSAYAYSHGLEAAMAEGRVRDARGCELWAASVLRLGSGALDAWAIRSVMRGAPARDVADTIAARAGSAERWEETRAMGHAFGATAEALGAAGPERWPMPVALGLAARGMAPAAVVALYLQALAGQIVSAATRWLPLGQVEGQAVLARLHPLIETLAAEDGSDPPGTAALSAEYDAMAHETLPARLFRT